MCIECPEFPCQKHKAKLSASHPEDPRFAYRRETVPNLERVQEVGVDVWMGEQDIRWRCPECNGRVAFYHYACMECGHEVFPQ